MKKARKVLRTKLCNLLGIDYPIMLAGMGIYQGDPLLAYSRAEPVAAVANADGMGITGRTRFLPEELRDEISRTRELTDKPFGVALLLSYGRCGLLISTTYGL